MWHSVNINKSHSRKIEMCQKTRFKKQYLFNFCIQSRYLYNTPQYTKIQYSIQSILVLGQFLVSKIRIFERFQVRFFQILAYIHSIFEFGFLGRIVNFGGWLESVEDLTCTILGSNPILDIAKIQKRFRISLKIYSRVILLNCTKNCTKFMQCV